MHGDLSAYNILYWEGHIALIDFPQVVPARDNRNAYAIFERDVTRLCAVFHRARGFPCSPAAWPRTCGRRMVTGSVRIYTRACWTETIRATASPRKD